MGESFPTPQVDLSGEGWWGAQVELPEVAGAIGDAIFRFGTSQPLPMAINDLVVGDRRGLMIHLDTTGYHADSVTLNFDWVSAGSPVDPERVRVGYAFGDTFVDPSGTTIIDDVMAAAIPCGTQPCNLLDFPAAGAVDNDFWDLGWIELRIQQNGINAGGAPETPASSESFVLPSGETSLWVMFWSDAGDGDFAAVDNVVVVGGRVCTVDSDCIDSNECTDDTCNIATGFCQFANNTSFCDDGVTCTAGDVCTAGNCVGVGNCPVGFDCDVVADVCVDPNAGGPNTLLGPDDFEVGFGSWSNVGGDNIDWTRDSGGTPSTGTGPIVDNTTGSANGFYLYTEASGNGTGYPNMTALLESPCIDLRDFASASWSFFYHMAGDSMGTLHAEVAPGCGTSWNTEITISGTQQAAQDNAYLEADIDLSAYAGTSVRLRFRAITGSSWSSDITIDDVRVTESEPITCSVDEDCNDGLFCTGVESCNEGVCQSTGDACGAALTCNEETDSCEELPVALVGPDDFETGFGSWANVAGDDIDWTSDSGGTPSNGTGPTVDHTTGSASGFYLYTEASGDGTAYPNMTALLEGPCIDLSFFTDASWTFWYHMAGDTMGNLHAEVAPGCGASWNTEFTLSGTQQGAQSNPYLQATIDLSAYSGTSIRLRFRGVTGSSWSSDMTIDDVLVEATPFDECSVAADCDDGLFCNGAEVCSSGICEAGTTIECDDGVSCTIDSCNELTDACEALPNDNLCVDNDVCNGTETCDAVNDCQPGTPLLADDGVTCTVDSCDPLTGISNLPSDNLCIDSDVCNGAETCDVVNDCQPGTPLLADDGVACTVDSCDPLTGISNLPSDSLCGDDDVCNGAETCDAVNDCQAGTPLVVDDGVSCTVDSCDPLTGISNLPNDNLCDDHDVCTGIETCDAVNDCQAGIPLVVDDGVSCTVDSCDPLTGSIANLPTDNLCGDNDVCDGIETCDAVNDCQAGIPLVADDGVSCTVDSCDPLTGISNLPSDNLCVDNDVCNGIETCDAVNDCQAGIPLVADDGVSCTVDSCDPLTGISNLPNDNLCGDNDVCNGAETCDAVNDCQPGVPLMVDDGVTCTVDSCDPLSGISNLPNDNLCGDNNVCNGAETCDAVNDCQAGTPLVADDGVSCTVDSCDPLTGIANLPNDNLCGDSDVCNGAETCDAVNDCQAGVPLICDNGAVCTLDSCDPADGCEVDPAPDGTLCDDGDPSTPIDTCSAGVCEGVVDVCAQPGGGTYYADTFDVDPEDWIDTANSNNQVVTGVFEGGRSIGGELAYGTGSARTNTYSHYVSIDSTTRSDYTFKVDGWIERSNTSWGAVVLSDWTGGTMQGTFVRVRRTKGSQQFQLRSSGTSCSGDRNTGFIPTPGVWFTVEIVLSDTGSGETLVEVRAWNRTDSRPEAVQASCVTPLNEGTFGVWKKSSGAAGWDNMSATCSGP